MDSRKRNKGRQEGQSARTVDASPGDDIPPVPNHRAPANVRETEAWKASQRGLNRFWDNYRNLLKTSFQGMSRAEQENLVTKLCIIVTIGVTVLAFLLFYTFIPRLGRVFGVPAAIFGAWWAGGRIVAPVVLGRMESLLNKE